MLNNLILKAGTKIHVSGDSAELWLTDYNVRVDSDGVVEIDSRPLDKKVLVALDEIDGERNVCVSIRKEKINVLEGENHMESLHFSITGEFITEAIQDLIHQNKYEKAFSAATMCMITSEEISEAEKMRLYLSILLGHSKLHGVSNEDGYLDEDSPEKSLQDLIQELLIRFDEKLQTLMQKEKQIEQLTLQRNYLLSCFQEDYPFSLQEYMEKFQEDWEEPFLNRKEAQELHLENIIYPPYQDSSSSLSTMVTEYVERITSQNENEEDKDYGWLSPTGIFYPVPWGEHNKWAYDYLKTHCGYTDLCTTKETDILCEKGWCLLHNPALGIARPTTLKPLTEKQKNFLYEYYDKRNKPELIREYCM